MDKKALTEKLQNLSKKDKMLLLEKLNHEKTNQLFEASVSEGSPSFTQESILMLNEISDSIPVNNINYIFSININIDEVPLFKTIKLLTKRHDSLRASFKTDRGQTRIVINEEIESDIVCRDLRSIAEDKREDTLQQLHKDFFWKPFDLTKAPLWRIQIIRFDDNKTIVQFVVHHIIFDGQSLVIFIREFAKVYDALLTSGSYEFDYLPMSYLDYTNWQHNIFWPENKVKLTRYWLTRLKGCNTSLDLPLDKIRPDRRSFRGSRIPIVITKEQYSILNNIARKLKITTYSLLLSLWGLLLHLYTHQDDFVIAMPVSNRKSWKTKNIIGCIVNTVPFRISFQEGMNYIEYAKSISKLLYSDIENNMPYSKLLHALSLPYETSKEPLCQTMLVEDRSTVKNNVLGFSQYRSGNSKI